MFHNIYAHLLIYCIIRNLLIFLHATTDETQSAYLWPLGEAAACPQGTEIPVGRCKESLRVLVPDDKLIHNDSDPNWVGKLKINTWSFTPCGCFIFTSGEYYHLDFDTKTTNCVKYEQGMIACTVPPPQYSISSVHLWPRSLKDRCPVGYAVSQEDCLNAGRALVPDNMPINNDVQNNGELFVDINTDYRPCGCSIWEDLDNNMYRIEFQTKTTDCKLNAPEFPNHYSRVVCDSPPPCFLVTCQAYYMRCPFINSCFILR